MKKGIKENDLKKITKEYVSTLEEKVDELVVKRDSLLKAARALDDQIDEIWTAIDFNNKFIKEPNNGRVNTTIKKIPVYNQNDNLESYTGAQLFLLGLKNLGKGEATVPEVTNEVLKLDTESIRKRVKNNTLKQWLTVSADSLAKAGQLKKDYRSDRKGGVIFRLKQ